MSSHRLIQVLQNEQAAEALINVGLDFFLDQELSSWLDLEIFFESVQSAYRPQVFQSLFSEWLPRALRRSKHLDPLIEHQLSTWLTPELDAELRSLLASTQFLSPQRIQEFIQHPLIKHITQAFVEETLQRFVQKAKLGQEGGGLIGLAGRSALGWANKASKGVFNGLGDQLQQQLLHISHEFISASMDMLLEQLGKIIATEEVARLLAEAQVDSYDRFKKQSLNQHLSLFITPYSEETEEAQQERIKTWAEILSDWITHLLESPQLSEIIGQLHQDIIEELGSQTPRTLINDEETVNSIKDSCITSLMPLLQKLIQQDRFGDWCINYLSED